MTRDELIQNVQRFMTATYGIPIKLSSEEINERIDDALRWFNVNYDQAVESKYYMVDRSHFQTNEFKADRKLQLPDCVVSVAECGEFFGSSRVGVGDSDLSVSRLIAADVFLGSFSTDELVNRVVYASYYDLSKAFIRDKLRYRFNYNTHELVLEGSDPRSNVILRTWVTIDENKLFDDYFFIEYVRGSALLSLGRMTTVITMNLPGGASLNTSELKSEGQGMMDKVREEIDGLQPGNYIDFFH